MQQKKATPELTINIHYTGANGSARTFMRGIIDIRMVDTVRAQPGNMRHIYCLPVDDQETVMLVNCWENQDALDTHHTPPRDSYHRRDAQQVRPNHAGRAVWGLDSGNKKHANMQTGNSLREYLDELHTTELGAGRIKRNLSFGTDNVVEWCKNMINLPKTYITRQEKNCYADIDGYIVIINARSHTTITAHRY